MKRKLPPEFDILQTIDDDAEEICKSQNKKILTENNFQIKPEVIEELDKIPKTEKQIRHEKRLKQLEKVYLYIYLFLFVNSKTKRRSQIMKKYH